MSFSSRAFPALKPGVGKVWLQLLAGATWLGVGLMLAGFALQWLRPLALLPASLLALAGSGLAAAIFLFGFSRLAKRNIERISMLPQKRVCLFAFQEWKSYPLVVFMVALGIYLRMYSPFPKPALAVLYLGIGGGLFLSSLHYFRRVAAGLCPSRMR